MNGSQLTEGQIEIVLFGSFDVIDATGKSRRPASSKARAILAILALSDGHQRSREWLRQILWSDRGNSQRAASLRQCLTEIRKALGGVPDILKANRQMVCLDKAKVKVNLDGGARGLTLLEDLTVRDPSFQDWLDFERSRLSPERVFDDTSQAGQKLDVVLLCQSSLDRRAVELEQQFEDVFAACLNDFGVASLRVAHGSEVPPGAARVVRLRAAAADDKNAMFRVTIEDATQGRRVWSERKQIMLGTPLRENAQFLSLCFLSADQAARAEGGGFGRSAAEAASVGLSKLFSIKRENVTQAETLFQRAVSLQPNETYFAWLAQTYAVQHQERYVVPDAAFREKADACCRAALATGSSNSNVLAAVANARTNIDMNYEAGVALGARSVQANPANPLAWAAFSNALVCVGNSKEAYLAALNAKVLAEKTRFEAWSELQVAVTAALLGKRDIAIAAGESAAALCPDFRPPLRYLCGLYALNGDTEGLARNAALLSLREPDFSISRMIEDDSYPIGVMRRHGSALTDALEQHKEMDLVPAPKSQSSEKPPPPAPQV